MCVCVCEGLVVRKVWNVFLIKWQRYIKAVHAVGARMCHCQVSKMQYLEHNLSKCATIVQPTLQLLCRVAIFLQHCTGILYYLCRFG